MRDSRVVDDVTRAAVELFAMQGYATTSVQQIVEAAGVTKGAMYHYFASKDDLLFAIYDSLLSLQQARLDEIVAEGGAAEDVVRRVCIDVLETSIDHLHEATVFFRSAHLLTADRQQEVNGRRRVYHDAFAALVRRGQEDGLFRDDMPLAMLVAHFFSDVHYLSHWYSPDGPEGKSAVAEHLADLFLAGIRLPA